MNSLQFETKQAYDICFLVPRIQRDEIKRAYIDPYGINENDVLVLDLHYGPNKKTPRKEMKAYFEEELVSILDEFGIKYVVIADADYFKAITGIEKVDANLGYVIDVPDRAWKAIYVPNYRAIFYDPPKISAKIAQGMKALTSHLRGDYSAPGNEVIKFAAYPRTFGEIKAWLDKLLDMNCPLAIDIETFSLKPHTAGIGTISFAWSKHEGIAFPVDYHPLAEPVDGVFAENVRNEQVRGLLRMFFLQYTQKSIYHSAAFDVHVLIYQLYMTDILDTDGLLRGMEQLLQNWDCTRLIAYLATNSCAGNRLSLKDLAQEFAGNYGLGEEVKDITKVPLQTLLEYNLVDTCATWHVFEKHWPTVIADQQEEIYRTLFQPATLDIVQMQLTGLPVDMARVFEVEAILNQDEEKALKVIESSPLVEQFTHQLNQAWVDLKNTTLKKKRVTLADAKEVFNPNSGPQLQELLYEVIGLPVIDTTKTGLPATGAGTLKSLKGHTKNADVLALLDALIDFASVTTILETFLPALKNAIPGPDGWHYLCGNFNLGGTISGRLSSSDPNLQNLPANSKYAKLIKSCISAREGFLLVGLDFSSLEDRISALTTKDPNKLKVYTDGYDGHCLRAYSYWPEQMPDIDPNSVESINSIQAKYKSLRQMSKVPTFALTYDGTYKTLMNQGFSEAEARKIESSFRELYKVSVNWVSAKLDQAAKDGFVTAAFGLRVRTPLLAQVIRGNRRTPHEAEAEGRSAGNALGQSWCLLNSRAWVEFMGKVRKSKHRLAIRPCAQIHDAGYAIVPDDVEVIAYMNEHLVKAVEWQDHPDIWHDKVKLGGELSIFWPTWANEFVLPNGANEETIPGIIAKALGA